MTRITVGAASASAPEGWQVLEIDEELPTVVAVEPDRGEARFRANVVLLKERLGGLGFADWQNGIDELMPESLDDYLLVDLERLSIDGREGGRRVAHHVNEDGSALVMEQWFTAIDDTGYTLTTTVDVHRFDLLADEIGAIGRSFGAEVIT